MDRLSKQRQDISSSFEDFERIMEDYFAIIPPDIDKFELVKTSGWEYDDLENTMMFYFDDMWLMDEFTEMLKDLPSTNMIFEYNEYEHLDREKMTITIVGKDGGLM